MSRIAAEVTVSVFIVTTGLTLLLIARRSPWLYPVSGLVLGLSVYTYPANTLFVPIIVASMVLIIKLDVRKIAITAGIFVFMCLPLLFASNSAGSVRIRQTNLTTESGTIDLMNTRRGDCTVVLPGAVCRVVVNKYYVFAEKFVTNFLSHFSPELLGASGSTTQYSILPPRGLLYIAELPLIVTALIFALKTDNTPILFLVTYMLAAAIPDSVTGAGHFGRFFISLPGWQIVAAYGVYMLRKYRVLLVGITLVFFLEMSAFAIDYVTYFPREYASFSHYGYKELVGNIEANKSRYAGVVVSSAVHDAKQYIFYLFYTGYDPALFQKGTDLEKGIDALGWVRVERVGNIYFAGGIPSTLAAHTLYIGSPSEFPENLKLNTIFAVKNLKGNIVFQGKAL